MRSVASKKDAADAQGFDHAAIDVEVGAPGELMQPCGNVRALVENCLELFELGNGLKLFEARSGLLVFESRWLVFKIGDCLLVVEWRSGEK